MEAMKPQQSAAPTAKMLPRADIEGLLATMAANASWMSGIPVMDIRIVMIGATKAQKSVDATAVRWMVEGSHALMKYVSRKNSSVMDTRIALTKVMRHQKCVEKSAKKMECLHAPMEHASGGNKSAMESPIAPMKVTRLLKHARPTTQLPLPPEQPLPQLQQLQLIPQRQGHQQPRHIE